MSDESRLELIEDQLRLIRRALQNLPVGANVKLTRVADDLARLGDELGIVQDTGKTLKVATAGAKVTETWPPGRK
jgi:hypothetical protein